ncbi:MAG: hypothetical protein JWN67_1150 [Actinomycetia bacterium]|nr:hypothetical protein [Actinomycetes bacterium]
MVGALWTSGAIEGLVSRTTKFGGFGVSFEFTEKSAAETRESIEHGLTAVRVKIRRRLAADVRAAGLQEAFATVLENAPGLGDKRGFRATIHIPDPLYANQLYQLLDYYPRGGGAGRAFSTRSGIIGMAWRNRRSDRWYQGRTDEVELRRMWGMTPEEAAERVSADSEKLFLAFPLFDERGAVPIGVFYFDAEKRDEMVGLPVDTPDDEVDAAVIAFLDVLEQHVTDRFAATMAAPLGGLVVKAKTEGPQLDLESQ